MDTPEASRLTLARADAVRLRDALEAAPETATLQTRIDDVGGDSDQAWVTIRATKAHKGNAIAAAWEVAKQTLGDDTPKSVIGWLEIKTPASARGGR